MKNLEWRIRKQLEVLNREGFPPEGICSHFGVGFNHEGVHVQISNHGRIDGIGGGPKVLITMYRFNTLLGGFHPSTFRRWKASLRKIAPILTTWNGGAGHPGISIVLDYPCPKSLIVSIENYLKLGFRVFEQSEEQHKNWEAFNTWYDEGFKPSTQTAPPTLSGLPTHS